MAIDLDSYLRTLEAFSDDASLLMTRIAEYLGMELADNDRLGGVAYDRLYRVMDEAGRQVADDFLCWSRTHALQAVGGLAEYRLPVDCVKLVRDGVYWTRDGVSAQLYEITTAEARARYGLGWAAQTTTDVPCYYLRMSKDRIVLVPTPLGDDDDGNFTTPAEISVEMIICPSRLPFEGCVPALTAATDVQELPLDVQVALPRYAAFLLGTGLLAGDPVAAGNAPENMRRYQELLKAYRAHAWQVMTTTPSRRVLAADVFAGM